MSPFPQSLIKADTDTQTCFLCKRTKEHWGKGIWKKQWKWICRCFLMGKLSNVDAVSKTSQTSVSAYKFTVMSPQTDRGLLHFSLALFSSWLTPLTNFLKQPNETSPENVQSLKRKPKDLRIITAWYCLQHGYITERFAPDLGSYKEQHKWVMMRWIIVFSIYIITHLQKYSHFYHFCFPYNCISFFLPLFF